MAATNLNKRIQNDCSEWKKKMNNKRENEMWKQTLTGDGFAGEETPDSGSISLSEKTPRQLCLSLIINNPPEFIW